MKLKTLLPLFFLALCLAAAGLVVGMRRVKPAMRGFTLYITQTSYPSTGAPIQTATKVRRQKPDGSWKLETTYSSGRFDVGYGEPGRGVFALNQRSQQLDYLSPSSGRSLADIDWTKYPGFAGEEMILGYKTFLIHTEGEGGYTDAYMCPTLEGYPLRLVSGNSRSKTVWETTQVILGEPQFESAPNLPVSKELYEQKAQRSGQ